MGNGQVGEIPRRGDEGRIRSYRDLRVWQEGMSLAEIGYRLTKRFPKDELFGMTSQIRRAASSIPANIAEGYGRDNKGEYIQFLRISQGSLKELETHLTLCARVGILAEPDAQSTLEHCDRLGKMLHRLIRSLQSSQRLPTCPLPICPLPRKGDAMINLKHLISVALLALLALIQPQVADTQPVGRNGDKRPAVRLTSAFCPLPTAYCLLPPEGAEPKIRPAGVAGGFYPADPKELTQMIDGLLARNTVAQVQGPLVALVCPHAGYMYTGPVAAACFAQLKGRKYTRVVVIAPSHFENFHFSSIYDGEAYATPLGAVPVDQEFRAKLAKLSSDIKISDRGHLKVGQNAEHALEVQLPWLQRTLGDFKLVPIIMGDQDYGLERGLGRALAKALLAETPEARAQTLILVSSDLSHYHPYDYAVNVDHQTLHAIEDWDYLSLSRNFAMWERGIQTWEACGGGPIVAGMIAAEGLGATHAQILKYANTGDATGDKSRVVGYGAVAITRGSAAEAKKSAEFTLTSHEKDALMKIARTSVETAVRDRKMYLVGSTGFPRLEEARGAFVTLKEHGELRGCIGYITPMKSLAETVRDVAAYAALEDSRFSPVSARELPLLEYEISVMSPLRRVLDIKDIKVGRNGLIMKKGDIEGLLLPQVPVEEQWDRDTFIEQTCLKAGLPRQAWKDDDTDIFMFTALVFGEHSPAEAALPERPTVPVPSRTQQPSLPGIDSPRP